jgi:hypothetical protein
MNIRERILVGIVATVITGTTAAVVSYELPVHSGGDSGVLVQVENVTPAAEVNPACDWLDEFANTLSDLHEQDGTWTIDQAQPALDGEPMLAVTTDAGVVVWEGIPCKSVADVVRHEHMHRQQIREFGSLEHAAEKLAIGDKDRLEITADCASMLAGSKYTPYVQREGGCTEQDLADARLILAA